MKLCKNNNKLGGILSNKPTFRRDCPRMVISLPKYDVCCHVTAQPAGPGHNLDVHVLCIMSSMNFRWSFLSAQKHMCITHQPRAQLHDTTTQACGQGLYEEVCILGWSLQAILLPAVHWLRSRHLQCAGSPEWWYLFVIWDGSLWFWSVIKTIITDISANIWCVLPCDSTVCWSWPPSRRTSCAA
jgi:hypothetical protein